MEAIAIVTVLALVQYLFFSTMVGSARGKYGVKGPAITGNEDFERIFRVHQNTMEQLVVFIPALWLYGHYVNPLWGAGIGVIYIIGRFIYCSVYCKNPGGRTLGFTLSFVPTIVMLLWVLVVVVMSYL